MPLRSWDAVLQDPEFQALIERTGRFGTNAEVMFLKPTDYSPVKFVVHRPKGDTVPVRVMPTASPRVAVWQLSIEGGTDA